MRHLGETNTQKSRKNISTRIRVFKRSNCLICAIFAATYAPQHKMSKLLFGFFLSFVVVITHAKTPKKCNSRFVVTQSSNEITPVLFGDLSNRVPSVVSWYIRSYLNGELPSDDAICSSQPPAISSASCVLEGYSSTLFDDISGDDRFANELLDDQFPIVFNCDGTILINQFPDGLKKINDECYGNIKINTIIYHTGIHNI